MTPGQKKSLLAGNPGLFPKQFIHRVWVKLSECIPYSAFIREKEMISKEVGILELF